MDKKLLILSGSPKKDGVTAQAVSQMINQIPRDILIKEYNAFRLCAKPCIDCGYCKTKQGCSFHDLDAFFADFEEADYVVFASPVYNQSFPSPMKAILERTQRYYNMHFVQGVKPTIAKHRKCGLIAVSGNDEEKAYAHMAYMLEQALTVLNGAFTTSMVIRNTDTNPEPVESSAVKSFAIKLLLG